MLLPNAENAFIPLEKLVDYSLSFNHPEGKHKARMFKSVLGITAEDVSPLYVAIKEAVLKENVTGIRQNEWGTKYTVDFKMSHNHKTATIRAGWIIDAKNKNPRLASCYVKL